MEFRNGMVNISPIGRNASVEERNEFQAYVLPFSPFNFVYRKYLLKRASTDGDLGMTRYTTSEKLWSML
jgi:hypothetical protein